LRWSSKVLACGDREQARRRSLYNGTGGLRLCWPSRRLAAAAALISALVVGGCSFRLDSVFPKGDADVEQTTASVGHSPADADSNLPPSEVDLAYARAVAADALARGGKDVSMPWENPHTGAGGNITPLAAAYTEGSFTCRDFLASYALGEKQSWLEGEACRTARGRWEVRSLKPLKRG
jgi:surface antigen